ncbi:MAG: TSUP family transporter, partial [Helicobacter apodemus]|nr:TSUP family transporter [Helicobacter apodemus]
MFEMEISILLLLFSVALIGGFIDSIAGGGGSITLPTLLFAGASPLEALATNKLQSSFGSFSATRHFYKKGYFSLKQCLPYAILVFVFSAFGTLSVQFINTDFLSKFLTFLIMVFGLYFLFLHKINEEKIEARFNKGLFFIY